MRSIQKIICRRKSSEFRSTMECLFRSTLIVSLGYNERRLKRLLDLRLKPTFNGSVEDAGAQR